MLQLIYPQFCLLFILWMARDHYNEDYITIKAKSEFQGPQFTVLYQAKLEIYFQGHIYAGFCFLWLLQYFQKKEEVTDFQKGEATASGNTDACIKTRLYLAPLKNS